MKNFLEAFAERFSYYLNLKGISQYSIWQNTGIYPSTINNVLNAKCKSINSKTMILLIKSCKVSISEFFDSKDFDLDKIEIE